MANKKRLIYADDLFEPVDHTVLVLGKGGAGGGKTMALYKELFRKRVEMAPTVDAEPIRHGHWIPKYTPAHDCGNSTHKLVYVCDQCGRGEPQVEPYCHCGAKMEGETV